MKSLLPALALLLLPGCPEEVAEEPPTPEIEPGTVTIHRLNRAEYDNTVRDLLGTTLRPARDFPPDDVGYGFDHIADVLSTSPLHVEYYERAVEVLVAEALAIPPAGDYDQLWEGETAGEEGSGVSASSGGSGGDHWNLWSNGDLDATADVPLDGTYILSARVWGRQAGPDPARAALIAGLQPAFVFDVPATSAEPMLLEAEVEFNAGPTRVGVSFLNDYYNPDLGEDRNLHVDWFRLQGPLDYTPEPNPQRQRIVTCDPEALGRDACARQVLAGFLPRAWRRPITAEEVDGFLPFFDLAEQEDLGFEAGLDLALRAALLSPHFLYRPELDSAPDDETLHPLGAYELANRLSYFLWSSMPDPALFAAAADGTLLDPAVLAAHARRMLADDKAEALVDNFAGQWLLIRRLDNVFPDPWVFPDWSDALRASMQEEVRRFFRSFLREGRPLSELLTSRETEVDALLASHYGLPGDFSGGWSPVVLDGTERGGLFGLSGVLTATSYPARTSPVARGKWVLTNLLCSAPLPPPPGVEGLPEGENEGGSLRDRMEAHRQDPTCASCHEVMDEIGFGLENFDGVGKWRSTYPAGDEVDASGVLPGDIDFVGGLELAAHLADNPFLGTCLARQLSTYALGRGAFVEDRPSIDRIAADSAEAGGRLEDLVVSIVTHRIFRERRGGRMSGRDL